MIKKCLEIKRGILYNTDNLINPKYEKRYFYEKRNAYR